MGNGHPIGLITLLISKCLKGVSFLVLSAEILFPVQQGLAVLDVIEEENLQNNAKNI